MRLSSYLIVSLSLALFLSHSISVSLSVSVSVTYCLSLTFPFYSTTLSQASAAETKASVEVEEASASKKASDTQAIADDAQRYVRSYSVFFLQISLIIFLYFSFIAIFIKVTASSNFSSIELNLIELNYVVANYCYQSAKPLISYFLDFRKVMQSVSKNNKKSNNLLINSY